MQFPRPITDENVLHCQKRPFAEANEGNRSPLSVLPPS